MNTINIEYVAGGKEAMVLSDDLVSAEKEIMKMREVLRQGGIIYGPNSYRENVIISTAAIKCLRVSADLTEALDACNEA